MPTKIRKFTVSASIEVAIRLIQKNKTVPHHAPTLLIPKLILHAIFLFFMMWLALCIGVYCMINRDALKKESVFFLFIYEKDFLN